MQLTILKIEIKPVFPDFKLIQHECTSFNFKSFKYVKYNYILHGSRASHYNYYRGSLMKNQTRAF